MPFIKKLYHIPKPDRGRRPYRRRIQRSRRETCKPWSTYNRGDSRKHGLLCLRWKSSYTVPAAKTRAIDTTGAGDAFAAGFLYRMLTGGTIKEAAKAGNTVASFCIRKPGARSGLPRREELKKRI